VKAIQEHFAFAALLGGSLDQLRRSAELGDAYAQGRVARSSTKERFQWTEKSVAQGERDGFFLLGCCHRDGVVCERNVERAKENFLIAAELGLFMVVQSNAHDRSTRRPLSSRSQITDLVLWQQLFSTGRPGRTVPRCLMRCAECGADLRI
jgi:hypothetical protein